MTRFVVTDQQITSRLGDESVILDLNRGIYYGLDSVGTRIWSLLESPHSIREICDVIEQNYDVQSQECEQAVQALVQDLAARSLVREHE